MVRYERYDKVLYALSGIDAAQPPVGLEQDLL